MPMDTMRPVMPARSKLGATEVWPEGRDDRPQHHGREHEARDHHEAKGPVIEEDVEQHQDQPDDAGAQARHQRRVAEGRRDRLGGGRLEGDRQGAVVHGLGQIVGVRLGQAPRDLSLAVERCEAGLRRLDDRRRVHLAVELDAQELVEVLLGDLVPQCRAGRRRPACSPPPTARSGSGSPGRWRWRVRHLARTEHAALAPVGAAVSGDAGQQDRAVRVVRLLRAGRRVRHVLGVRRNVVRREAWAEAVGCAR